MTKEELKSLPAGSFVNHKECGLCKVTGHSFALGVDLEILEDGCEMLGHYKQILETRSSLMTHAKRVTEENYKEVIKNAARRAKIHRPQWQKDIMRHQEYW